MAPSEGAVPAYIASSGSSDLSTGRSDRCPIESFGYRIGRPARARPRRERVPSIRRRARPMAPESDPKLVVLAGPLEGMTLPFTSDELTIGRESSNHLPIDDRSVSRRHCVIAREGERFRVRDLESHNGTLVNDVSV